MANVYDFLGDQADYFMKSSLQVYNNLSGNMQYVGKTSNEKTLSPNLELVEWFDNTGGTQTRFVLDIDKFDFNMQFSFSQILDPNVLALAWNGDLDNSDPNRVFTFFGSSPNPLAEAEWRFTGASRSSLEITLVIRRGVCVPNGDWAAGTPGEYTGVSAQIMALQDTTISNTKRDMAYFIMDKRSAS
jgi:hypothetical protein